jgi:hypothetical protein
LATIFFAVVEASTMMRSGRGQPKRRALAAHYCNLADG